MHINKFFSAPLCTHESLVLSVLKLKSNQQIRSDIFPTINITIYDVILITLC